MTTPKPCPICGESWFEIWGGREGYSVQCLACGHEGAAMPTQAAAVTVWGAATRPETPAEAARSRSHAVRDRRRLRQARRGGGR